MATYIWTWLQVQQQRVRAHLDREDGVVGMEYAVVAAVVIVAVALALEAGTPAIGDIVDAALEEIESQIG